MGSFHLYDSMEYAGKSLLSIVYSVPMNSPHFKTFDQANFINTYEGNTDAFKTLPSGYSTYTTFLNLFGWGGKTKWYCFYMVLANIAVFKFLSLWASAYTAINRKGGKRNVDQE